MIVALEGVGVHNGGGAEIQYALSLLRDVGDIAKLYAALQYLALYPQATNFNFIASYPSPVGSTLVAVTNLPKRWCELYQERNYEEVDPIAIHCRARMTPILWWSKRNCDDLPGYGVHTRSFVSEARSFGMHSGASFPLHGINGSWGVLTLSYQRDLDETKPRLEQSVPYIQLLSAYVFEAAGRAIGPQQNLDDQGVTRREMECLLWCSEGKTSWEIAKILGISERTVHFHMQNASRKLGASNRSHAVRLALRHIGAAVAAQSPPHRVIRLWSTDDVVEQVEIPEIHRRHVLDEGRTSALVQEPI